MRITQRTLTQNSLTGINRNMVAISKLQDQLTSGKTITKPSDSPTGTNSSLQLRGALAASNQYQRNMTDGKSWLSTTDTALESMTQQVQRVRDLTVQAMNTGSMSGTDQQAIAAEVSQLQTSLLGLANTQVGGRPIFGGTTSDTSAYAADGTYTGRGGTAADPATPNTRRISAAATVRVDVTGAEAFGDQSQGDDLFAVVGKIADLATSDPSQLGDQLSALDTAISRMSNALSDVGARMNRITNAQSTNTDLNLSLTSQLSGVEDTDMAKSIMNLQLQQTSYQAALSVSASALQQTLVDFLR